MEVVIRKAQIADIYPMAKLLGQLFAIESDFPVDAKRQQEGLLALITRHNAHILVAKYKNRPIGMVTMQEYISTAEGGRAGIVEDMVIDAAFRKQGIGRKLQEALFDLAQERTLVRLHLAIDSANEGAKAFYDKQGWHATSLGIMHHKLD